MPTTLQIFKDTVGAGRCRSCGAAIVWCQTTLGRWLPLNRDPIYVGTIVVNDRVVGTIDPKVTIAHFATCPQADEWRRAGNRTPQK